MELISYEDLRNHSFLKVRSPLHINIFIIGYWSPEKQRIDTRIQIWHFVI